MVHPPFKMAQMALDATPKTPDDDWRDADTPSFFATEWRLCMLFAFVAYVVTTFVVCGFAAHSVRRHGWRRRTLRRYSYVLFLSFTLCRALGCALSLLQPAPSDAWQAARPLVVPPWPLAIDRLAFCSYFGGFSLLVCGWADSACAAACPRHALPAPRAARSARLRPALLAAVRVRAPGRESHTPGSAYGSVAAHHWAATVNAPNIPINHHIAAAAHAAAPPATNGARTAAGS